MRYLTGILLICFNVLTFPDARAIERKDQEPSALFSAMYDFNVCDYCGLVSAEVYDGYRREIRSMIATGNLPDEYVHKTEVRAMAAVEEEYMNRGLGGFRLWCRMDGKAAVERFVAYRAQILREGDGSER